VLGSLRQSANWRFRELEAGHWPMVSVPDELAALLTEAVIPPRSSTGDHVLAQDIR
jgi:hypothetical protein